LVLCGYKLSEYYYLVLFSHALVVHILVRIAIITKCNVSRDT